MAAFNQRLQLLLLIILRRRLRKRKQYIPKKFWVRPFLAQRGKKGLYNILVKELFLYDHEYFFHSFRMSPATFESLLQMVAPYIVKSTISRDW